MVGEIEMATHEGVCRFCGNIKPVMAVDQVDADEKISEGCSCGGYFKEKRMKHATENIKKAFRTECMQLGLPEVEDEAVKLLIHIANAINEDQIQSASLNIGGVKAALSITAKGKIKVVRTDSTQRLLEA